MHDALTTRMKDNYENVFRTKLPMRMPVILRVDGKAFSQYTKKLEKPFDKRFIYAMSIVAISLCQEIQGAQVAYHQSDEISILIHNYKRLSSSAWFDNNIQKMVSVASGIASANMTMMSQHIFGEIKPAFFDARVFVLPEAEVNNYFVARQQDCTRNSIQMMARSLASHKECNHKNQSELQELIFQKGKNWNDLPTHLKRGRCFFRQLYEVVHNGKPATRSCWSVDDNIPIFSKNPNYIEKFLETIE